ncbi:hypothetical protein NDU88_009333 [Pleurodeles waltl]|uniref:Uncharacterized protein n=1 Tax=Pleurodeles waltl TaxID=8319 RepID=A0AAV7RX99_PLEWA|nr:hypothetical protein NDU88_009333 [Pleurodeles waltl]
MGTAVCTLQTALCSGKERGDVSDLFLFQSSSLEWRSALIKEKKKGEGAYHEGGGGGGSSSVGWSPARHHSLQLLLHPPQSFAFTSVFGSKLIYVARGQCDEVRAVRQASHKAPAQGILYSWN